MTNQFPTTWPAPERKIHRGQAVSLTPLDAEQDVADLYDLSHNPPAQQALWTYLFNGPFPTQAAMLTWLRSVQNLADPIFFTVTSLAHERKVGMISIMSIVPGMGRAELGSIWYAPLVQRTQVNSEATYLLLRYLFEELNYRRVEWKCDNRNEPSKRAARRMGFQAEGLFRQHMVVKGQNRDTAWFSMLDSEWPQRKANFEAWLYAASPLSLTVLNA
jgi:RimJ/RimL family protein N-acetyltransferase